MSSTSKNIHEESIIDADSWEEVSNIEVNPVSYYPVSGVEKMLLDAQKEGSEASLSSRHKPSTEDGSGSEDGNSRTPTPASDDHHPGLNVLSTQSGVAQRKQGCTDWIWDWSSRPDIHPPKKWKLHHPTNSGLSIRNSKSWKDFLSNEILSVLIISNLVTFVVSFGLGIFVMKRAGSGLLARVLK